MALKKGPGLLLLVSLLIRETHLQRAHQVPQVPHHLKIVSFEILWCLTTEHTLILFKYYNFN